MQREHAILDVLHGWADKLVIEMLEFDVPGVIAESMVQIDLQFVHSCSVMIEFLFVLSAHFVDFVGVAKNLGG